MQGGEEDKQADDANKGEVQGPQIDDPTRTGARARLGRNWLEDARRLAQEIVDRVRAFPEKGMRGEPSLPSSVGRQRLGANRGALVAGPLSVDGLGR